MEPTVRGRPGRLGRDRAAWRHARRSRCQRSTVSGRTAAGTGQAPPVGAGAAGRPGTPGRWGGTAAGSRPVAAPGPRSGGVAPRSPGPCPGRSSEEAAVTRTRSSHSDRPVEAAQPIIMPQRADLGRATSSCGLRRNRIAALPGRMRFSAQAPAHPADIATQRDTSWQPGSQSRQAGAGRNCRCGARTPLAALTPGPMPGLLPPSCSTHGCSGVPQPIRTLHAPLFAADGIGTCRVEQRGRAARIHRAANAVLTERCSPALTRSSPTGTRPWPFWNPTGDAGSAIMPQPSGRPARTAARRTCR